MADERIIYACIYQHFKGGKYQVLEIAENAETGEKMVVYKALYARNRNRVYVRSYEMFASEVDHKKYPDVKQKYCFERVNPTELLTGCLCSECQFNECCSIQERLQDAFASSDRTSKKLSCSFGVRRGGL